MSKLGRIDPENGKSQERHTFHLPLIGKFGRRRTAFLLRHAAYSDPCLMIIGIYFVHGDCIQGTRSRWGHGGRNPVKEHGRGYG